MSLKESINRFKKWLERRKLRKTQRAFDKWYIQNRIEVLHQYLLNNDYIDEGYIHKQLDNILDKINKL